MGSPASCRSVLVLVQVFTENNYDGGFASLSVNPDSTYVHYSNYGSVHKLQHYWETSVPPRQTFSGESKGNYIGTLMMKSDSIIYDNGRYPLIYDDMAPNPLFLVGSENLSTVNVYSIRLSRFNPNSYFVIANNNVHHIPLWHLRPHCKIPHQRHDSPGIS